MSAPKPLPEGLSARPSALLGAARRLAAAEHAEAEANTSREDSGTRILLRIRRIAASDAYDLLYDTANGAERDASADFLLNSRTKPTIGALRERQPKHIPLTTPTLCFHGFSTSCSARCAD